MDELWDGVPKTLGQGLPSLLPWVGKGWLLLVLRRDSRNTAHPSFCTACTINRAVQEQSKDQQLEFHSCSHWRLWSWSSGAAACLSSSLLSTFHPNYNVVVQINFFLLQLSQGFSPWLVSCQKHLPNYCFTSRFGVLTPPVPWKPFFHGLLLWFLICYFAV